MNYNDILHSLVNKDSDLVDSLEFYNNEFRKLLASIFNKAKYQKFLMTSGYVFTENYFKVFYHPEELSCYVILTNGVGIREFRINFGFDKGMFGSSYTAFATSGSSAGNIVKFPKTISQELYKKYIDSLGNSLSVGKYNLRVLANYLERTINSLTSRLGLPSDFFGYSFKDFTHVNYIGNVYYMFTSFDDTKSFRFSLSESSGGLYYHISSNSGVNFPTRSIRIA